MLVRKVAEVAGTLPETYDEFAKISQVLQAEAVKRFIEIFRSEKWRRTGIIYWNLTDGWPISCESVVDYFGIRKLAFYFMRRAYEPIYLMLKKDGEKMTLVASNDTQSDEEISFKVTDVASGAVLCEGKGLSKANEVTALAPVVLPARDTFAFIEWTVGGKRYSSHYFADVTGCDMEKYLLCLKKCGYDEFEGF